MDIPDPSLTVWSLHSTDFPPSLLWSVPLRLCLKLALHEHRQCFNPSHTGLMSQGVFSFIFSRVIQGILLPEAENTHCLLPYRLGLDPASSGENPGGYSCHLSQLARSKLIHSNVFHPLHCAALSSLGWFDQATSIANLQFLYLTFQQGMHYLR